MAYPIKGNIDIKRFTFLGVLTTAELAARVTTVPNGTLAFNSTTQRLNVHINSNTWAEVSFGIQEITGQFSGSSTTFAALPTVDALGDAVSNGDWAVLTADDGANLSGIYMYDGANYNFVMEIPDTFTEGNITEGTLNPATDPRSADFGGNPLTLANTSNFRVESTGSYTLGDGAGGNLPAVDSDGLDFLLSINNVDGSLGEMNTNAFKLILGAGDPVDGAVIAFNTQQLYLDTTNLVFWRVLTPSADPDAGPAGSTFQILPFSQFPHDAVANWNQHDVAVWNGTELEGQDWDYIFADDTASAPAVAGMPTAAEIQANIATPNTYRNRFIYYNGTDVAGSPNGASYVFYVDGAGDVSLLRAEFTPRIGLESPVGSMAPWDGDDYFSYSIDVTAFNVMPDPVNVTEGEVMLWHIYNNSAGIGFVTLPPSYTHVNEQNQVLLNHIVPPNESRAFIARFGATTWTWYEVYTNSDNLGTYTANFSVADWAAGSPNTLTILQSTHGLVWSGGDIFHISVADSAGVERVITKRTEQIAGAVIVSTFGAPFDGRIKISR